MPPGRFAEHLDILTRSGYRFVGLDALIGGLDGTFPMPARGVLVSFDDCYEDLATVAAPLLKDRGIPAVAFAVAGRLGQTNDWDPPSPGGPLKLLDAPRLAELESSNVEIGSHSFTHRRLTMLVGRERRDEVTASRDALVREGLGPIRAFAYPYGDHCAEAVAAVRAAGHQVAFTTEAGVVTAGSDPYRLPRMEVRRDDSGFRFRLRIAAAQAPDAVRRLHRSVFSRRRRGG